MTARVPLVLGDDGLLQQLQAGDSVESQALATILLQNSLILKMLAPLYLQHIEDHNDLKLSDDEVNEILGELL